MHHEKNVSQEIMSQALLEKELGPTGRFPGGKLTSNDEGEIALAVGVLKGKVVVNFGTPIASLGMSPAQAEQLAITLIRRAGQARGEIDCLAELLLNSGYRNFYIKASLCYFDAPAPSLGENEADMNFIELEFWCIEDVQTKQRRNGGGVRCGGRN